MGFSDEILEHGAALRNLIAFYRGEGEDVLCSLKRHIPEAGGRIVFTGMGSSLCASYIVSHRLSPKVGLTLHIDAGELLHYSLAGIHPEDMVIAISQSGQSAETRRVTEVLSGHPHLITITNEPDNPMATCATVNLPLCAGTEESLSGKTYTNTLALLFLVAVVLLDENLSHAMDRLQECSSILDTSTTSRGEDIRAAADFLCKASTLHFVARGPCMASAYQCALTWMEGAYMTAAALSGGAFRHGPLELAGPEHHAVCFAPRGPSGALVIELSREMAAYGSRVLVFTSDTIEEQKGLFSFYVEPAEEDLMPIGLAGIHALLLVQMAHDRGTSPGVFRYGSKVTDHE